MTLNDIDILARTIPIDDPFFDDAKRELANRDRDYHTTTALSRNLETYIRQEATHNDLRFGYNYVWYLIRTRRNPPSLIKHPWIYNFYTFERTGKNNPMLSKLKSFMTGSQRYKGDRIEAYLLIPEMTNADIAKAMNLPVQCIDAYVELFFNIRIRMDDPYFIAHHVFPDSRLQEMYENYASITPD
jgi:hypothetical protein